MLRPNQPPSEDALRGFLLGLLPPEELEAVGRYLEANPAAISTLKALKTGDTLLESLRSPPRTGVPDSAELADLMTRLSAFTATPSQTGDQTISSPTDPADPAFAATIDPDTTADPNADLAELLAPAECPGELGRVAEYRVLRVLGRGGMGAVFEAEDTKLGRRVALKVMLPALAASSTAKKRFVQEAKTAAKVEHDHIVPIYQIGEFRGAPFLAMPLLAGEGLDERLKYHRLLPVAEVLVIGRQVAEGLAAAHAAGLIHRDIKPSNIWLERHADGSFKRVRILDFGLAKGQTSAGGELTHSGVILGTPAYMAPEQGRGVPVDSRADLFSLGSVLYQMTTGKRPFKGSDTFAILTALATATPPAPIAVNPAVPTPLSELIVKLLAKDPTDRPQSAKDVAESLNHIAAGLPAVPAAVGNHGGQARRYMKDRPQRRRPLLVAAGVLFLALAAVGAYNGKTIVRVVNNEGELVVEVDDPNVEVVVKGEAVEIRREENGKKRVFLVKAGKDGEVEVREPGSDAVLVMEKFKVTRAGKVEVLVTAEKLAAARVKPSEAPNSVPDPNRFTNSIGMEFVLIPKGTAWLGGSNGVPGEKKVDILEDFYLGKYEVTQEEWQKITGQTPSHFSREGPGKEAVKDISDAELKRFPVEKVSWEDAQLFLAQLNKREKEAGWVYRLPKDAEWDYACRGGPSSEKLESAFDFYFDTPLKELLLKQANFAPEPGKGLQRTCKVGSYPPNRLGLYDMHGNVEEWCVDMRKVADGAVRREFRGGSWFNGSRNCRAAFLNVDAPSARGSDLGLRLARVPVGREDKPGYTNSLDMKFALVPKGKSWLGGGAGKLGDKEVEIKDDFYLGVYEVTQEEWEKVTGLTPSLFSRTGTDKFAVKLIPDADLKRFPVENVSWEDVQPFIKRLNERDNQAGWLYRLPTEVEWEYACRGGPMTDKFDGAYDFYFDKPTNQLSPEQANFEHGNGLKRTCQVGSYKPNGLGLYDMHGNVWEWCADEIAADPKEPQGALRRVYRGGAWYNDPGECRAVDRTAYRPAYRSQSLGLRLARVRVSTDPDRTAAEWVLSVGGTVRVDDEDRDLKAAADLPAKPFRLTQVRVADTDYRVTDADLARFADCRHLTSFWFAPCAVTNDGLKTFAGLPQATIGRPDGSGRIWRVVLDSPRITDDGVKTLSRCTGISTLGLRNAAVTDNGLTWLSGLMLTDLDVRGTKMTEAGLRRFANRRPGLRVQWDGKAIAPAPKLPLGDTPPAKDAFPGSLVFYDTFDDPKLTLSTIGDGPVRTVIRDGKYTTTIPDGKGVRRSYLTIPHEPVDSSAGAFAMRVRADASTFWLNFRQRQQSDRAWWLLLNLDADGRWQLTSRESRTVKGKQEFLPATVTLAESGGALPELAGQWVNVAGRWSETEYELFLNGKRVAGGPVADPAGAVPTLRPTGVKLGIRMDRDGPAAFDIDYAAVWDLADSDRLAAQHALSIGGTVRVNSQEQDIKDVADLPKAPFRLTHVDLQKQKQVTDADLIHFKDCKHLTNLHLESTQVNGAGLAHLKDCANLTHLYLHSTEIGDSGLAHLQDCTKLIIVWVNNTKISDACTTHFKKCKQLVELNLEGTQIGDASVENLSGLTTLRVLSLKNTKFTAAGIAKLKAALPECKIEWDGSPNEPKK